MSNRGLFAAAVSVSLVGGGLLALGFPVFLDSYDQWGFQIKCGTGFAANLSQALSADAAGPASNHADLCATALATRRAWAIPLVAVGCLVLTALTIVWVRSSPRSSTAGVMAQSVPWWVVEDQSRVEHDREIAAEHPFDGLLDNLDRGPQQRRSPGR